jgi:hypothetical protein
MSPCNPCDPTGCAGVPSGIIVLKKLDYMISDHYTLLGILAISLIILGLALSYFMKSMQQTLKQYYRALKKQEPSSGDNPRSAKDDDYKYYDIIKDDPDKVQPENMEAAKLDFTKELGDAYNEYNKLKTEYLKKTHNVDNDDVVDTRAYYKTHDTYTYKKPEDDEE